MTLSSFKNTLKSYPAIVAIYQKIQRAFRATLYDISPFLLVSYHYYKAHRKRLVLSNPRNFEDKLIWLMLYWNHPLKTVCADKYAVRSYVEALGLENILVPLYGVYHNCRQIDFDKLPKKFVLKCTHGSKFNIICRDKSQLNIDESCKLLTRWQKIRYQKLYGEIHYAGIKPLIICEQLLEDESGHLPVDYKMFCFQGKVHCTMVCSGRYTDNIHFDYFDRDWKQRLPYGRENSPPEVEIGRPQRYEEMLSAAEKLSKPFPFVRIDMYEVKGRVYFGEMTFTPSGCIDTGLTETAQNEMGELLILPNLKI